MSSVYKMIALEHISDEILTRAGALGALSNGLSRLFWSYLLDSYSFTTVYFIMMVIQFTNGLLIYPMRSNETVYPFIVILCFFTYGAHFSILPTQIAKLYGIKRGP